MKEAISLSTNTSHYRAEEQYDEEYIAAGMVFGVVVIGLGIFCYVRTINKYLSDEYNGETGVR